MPRHSPYALLRLNFSKRIFQFSLLGSRSILNCLSFVNKYLLGFLFALKKLPFSLLLNLHLSVKLYFTHFFGKTYLISFKLIKSVLFYLFVLLFNILYSVFNEHIRNLCSVVGLDGLEPSTSRLSGVRSSHLSYRPSIITRSSSFPSFSDFGGDEGARTPDPLLAKQVLSQLSYTPIREILFSNSH